MLKVTYDNQPSEINSLRSAQVNGITYGAFPYQPYLSTVSNVTVKVFAHLDVMQSEFKASAILYKNFPDGSSKAMEHEHFKTFDEAFYIMSTKLAGFGFFPYP